MPGVIMAGIRGIELDVQKGYVDVIFPELKSYMEDEIKSWPDAILNTSDSPILQGFEYSTAIRKNAVLRFRNISKHAKALIEGVSGHWVDASVMSDWARQAGFIDTPFIYVGGKNSRIKKGSSERDFWNPVLDLYFNTQGKDVTIINDKIYKGLKNRLK